MDIRGAARVDATKVTCPVLVVAATLDKITLPASVRKIAAKYKTVSTYKEYENHSHWLLIEPGWQKIAGDAADWTNQIL